MIRDITTTDVALVIAENRRLIEALQAIQHNERSRTPFVQSAALLISSEALRRTRDP
jgi:hypothetical protein